MRNINELVGLIKGIDFDGIINEKEVKRLQSWVDKNRNLVYDKKQIEIIKLLDTVLEDHIIEEHEKRKLFDFCEKYLKNEPYSIQKIYELKGIIEGIICDGVVNESEVLHLKKWMDENEDVVRNHKPSEKLCSLVDDILLDGVVTEEEQDTLLEELSKRISGSHLQLKIAHLKKLVKSKENIGIDLIELLDNDDAIEEIHLAAENELNKAMNFYSYSVLYDQEMIFISLVLIAMLHYDGSFYDGVQKTYKRLYNRYSEQKIEGTIRTILNRYRPVNEYHENKSRIINVALMNAIVPRYYLAPFFVFIFDIYKLNFEYDLSNSDLVEDFRFVYEGLRNSMLSEGDDVKVNVTKKTYKLIQSTKKLIVNEKYIDP